MKKILLAILTCWLVGVGTAKAQIMVGSINVDSLDIQYIELIGFNRSTWEASVWIDFGRNYTANKSSEFLKPLNDHEWVRFASVVDALNYIYKNGWELVNVYVPSPDAPRHYVLQRRSQAVK
ncbi:hypothetical protein EXU85_12930 [Spirosoma sp. KCTC 42546]|uniref:hypothetical protein n=1 Tax=Spirosoma sp. KCTC 42546 TaxID=2520506 RepID=UPI001156ECC3|nr:hypothetical protein [Spirosoma sp. KCTC 42546]QDK79457.1 hypothetical protein EXU85_12930 [Spirosoma sp. KCTC 42546]